METIILIAATSSGASVLAAAGLCFFRQRKNRQLIESAFEQIEELESALADSREKLEESTLQAADQARRIAWLETRLRQPRTARREILEETVLTADHNPPSRPNITERRHRVLSLAGSGQNAETIAATLGMLPGEVELIINLNRASFAQFA